MVEIINTNSKEVRFVTVVGMVLNFVLAIAKFVLGTIGQSQALVADAVHSLSDSGSDIIIIVGSFFWDNPPDRDHPYGHKRIETLISIIIGFMVAAVGVFICWRGINNLINENYVKPGLVAAIGSFASIVVKEGLYKWTIYRNRGMKNSALTANAWHHRSDAISSIPVLFAIVIAYFYPELIILDAIGAVVVSVFILASAYKIITPGIEEILDTGVSYRKLEQIKEVVKSVSEVRDVHDVRTRRVGGGIFIDLHIVVDPTLTVLKGHHISNEVVNELKSDERVVDVLVHIDPYDDSIPEITL